LPSTELQRFGSWMVTKVPATTPRMPASAHWDTEPDGGAPGNRASGIAADLARHDVVQAWPSKRRMPACGKGFVRDHAGIVDQELGVAELSLRR